ncbi:MAG: phage portal protein [Planctomycetota bacterium]
MPVASETTFRPTSLRHERVQSLLAEHRQRERPRLRRFWRYYRNRRVESASHGSAAGPWDQEEGLPDRLRRSADGQPHRELVIENDIAWRIHTQVDFMFGKAIAIKSLSADPELAARIEALLNAVFRASGGVAFLQDMALLGSVYGSADVLVRCDVDRLHGDAAGGFLLELIEAPRAVPVMSPGDYRQLDAYLIDAPEAEAWTAATPMAGWLRRLRGRIGPARPGTVRPVECWTPTGHQFVRPNGSNTALNPLGCVPVVNIQNLPQPFHYAGLSDVEPLIPLQDELNTRLSDRANRVTMSAFKMYLAKGLEGFNDRPVGPGTVWASDNPDASIQAFGGDSETPSEDAHIADIREALDKASGVSPIAAGVLRGKVGNLTSENAVRIVLLGMMARTEKKRITYGAGIERCCELILHAADVHGLLPNRPEDRRVRIDWPDPFPESRLQQLELAERKLRLGVPKRQVLTELGYAESTMPANDPELPPPPA